MAFLQGSCDCNHADFLSIYLLLYFGQIMFCCLFIAFNKTYKTILFCLFHPFHNLKKTPFIPDSYWVSLLFAAVVFSTQQAGWDMIRCLARPTRQMFHSVKSNRCTCCMHRHLPVQKSVEHLLSCSVMLNKFPLRANSLIISWLITPALSALLYLHCPQWCDNFR